MKLKRILAALAITAVSSAVQAATLTLEYTATSTFRTTESFFGSRIYNDGIILDGPFVFDAGVASFDTIRFRFSAGVGKQFRLRLPEGIDGQDFVVNANGFRLGFETTLFYTDGTGGGLLSDQPGDAQISFDGLKGDFPIASTNETRVEENTQGAVRQIGLGLESFAYTGTVTFQSMTVDYVATAPVTFDFANPLSLQFGRFQTSAILRGGSPAPRNMLTVQPVPLPAGAWLLLGGVGALAVARTDRALKQCGVFLRKGAKWKQNCLLEGNDLLTPSESCGHSPYHPGTVRKLDRNEMKLKLLYAALAAALLGHAANASTLSVEFTASGEMRTVSNAFGSFESYTDAITFTGPTELNPGATSFDRLSFRFYAGDGNVFRLRRPDGVDGVDYITDFGIGIPLGFLAEAAFDVGGGGTFFPQSGNLQITVEGLNGSFPLGQSSSTGVFENGSNEMRRAVLGARSSSFDNDGIRFRAITLDYVANAPVTFDFGGPVPLDMLEFRTRVLINPDTMSVPRNMLTVVAAVPLPAGAWLMLAGLGALGLARSRGRS